MTDLIATLDKDLPHYLFKEVRSELMDFIDSASPGEVAFLIGSTGVGKKTVLESSLKKTLKSHEKNREKNPQLMPVAVEKLEPVLDQKTYITELIESLTSQLLPRFNIPAESERKILMYERISNRLTPEKKRQQLEQTLKERGTKILALYDAHLLPSKRSFRQQVFETFQSIAANSDCALIIVGDYKIRDLEYASTSFLCSSTFIHFPVYSPYTNEKHKDAWKNIIGVIISKLPDCYGDSIVKMDSEILSRSLGSYGLLVDWIKKAIRFKQQKRNNRKSFQQCLVHTQKSDRQLIPIQDDIDSFIEEQKDKKLRTKLRNNQSATKSIESTKKRNSRPGKSNSGERIEVRRSEIANPPKAR